MLLIYCQTLRKSEISQSIINLIFDELRMNDNPTSLDIILEKIDSIESTFNCARKTSKHIYKARDQEEEKRRRRTVSYVKENMNSEGFSAAKSGVSVE